MLGSSVVSVVVDGFDGGVVAHPIAPKISKANHILFRFLDPNMATLLVDNISQKCKVFPIWAVPLLVSVDSRTTCNRRKGLDPGKQKDT